MGEDQSELLTDAFDIEFKHDFFYEVKSAWCLVGGQTIDIGANSSADGPDDEVDAAEKVINVIDAGPSSHLGTRPNISESHSEISTRVPHCITGAVAGRSFEYPPEHQRVP